jgi:exonuclease VII large subunit
MELATPDKNELLSLLDDYLKSSCNKMNFVLAQFGRRFSGIAGSYGFKAPMEIIRRKSQNLDNSVSMFFKNMDRKILIKNNRLALLTKSLESHDIKKTLKKGFVLVKQDSKYVTRSVYFDPGKSTLLKFYDDDINIESDAKKD